MFDLHKSHGCRVALFSMVMLCPMGAQTAPILVDGHWEVDTYTGIYETEGDEFLDPLRDQPWWLSEDDALDLVQTVDYTKFMEFSTSPEFELRFAWGTTTSNDGFAGVDYAAVWRVGFNMYYAGAAEYINGTPVQLRAGAAYAVVNVPEPTTLALMGLGLALPLAHKRHWT